MVMVIRGSSVIEGLTSYVSLDLMSIVVSLNVMKKEEPAKYNSIRYAFIDMAKKEEDKYLYSELKEFCGNLKDFFE